MSFFGKKPRTAQQKAQSAKTRILLRSIALGYVIFYIVIPMMSPDFEEAESMHPALRYGVLAFFIVVCTALVIGTVLEFIRNRKAGLYNADAYEDDEGIESPAVEEPEPDEDEDDNGDDDEYYDEDDEYYDDDDDEDYDEDDEDYDDDDDEEDSDDDGDGGDKLNEDS